MNNRKKIITVFLGIFVLLAALGCVRTMTAKGEPDKNKNSALIGQILEALPQETETREAETADAAAEADDTTEYQGSGTGGEEELQDAGEREDQAAPLQEEAPGGSFSEEPDAGSWAGEEKASESPEKEGASESPEIEAQECEYDTGYIFLGDSRIYLMNEDCGIGKNANFFTVCSPGMGYDWMVSEGLPKLKNIQKRHSEIQNWVVVSAFGINDMQNINKYISAYRKLAKTAELWLVSVNPTMGRMEPQYSNVCIEAFNQRLRKISGISYIDSYGYLLRKGYDTKDGLHYTESSNWDIYSYILNSLSRGRDSAPAPDTDARSLAEDLAGQLGRVR